MFFEPCSICKPHLFSTKSMINLSKPWLMCGLLIRVRIVWLFLTNRYWVGSFWWIAIQNGCARHTWVYRQYGISKGCILCCSSRSSYRGGVSCEQGKSLHTYTSTLRSKHPGVHAGGHSGYPERHHCRPAGGSGLPDMPGEHISSRHETGMWERKYFKFCFECFIRTKALCLKLT